jgi:hypothetical protein
MLDWQKCYRKNGLESATPQDCPQEFSELIVLPRLASPTWCLPIACGHMFSLVCPDCKRVQIWTFERLLFTHHQYASDAWHSCGGADRRVPLSHTCFE